MRAEGSSARPRLIPREYTLDDVNQGYEDMHNGRNLRGRSTTPDPLRRA